MSSRTLRQEAGFVVFPLSSDPTQLENPSSPLWTYEALQQIYFERVSEQEAANPALI